MLMNYGCSRLKIFAPTIQNEGDGDFLDEFKIAMSFVGCKLLKF
jgi:hypothetical protein